MPFYAYHCDACEHEFDVRKSMSKASDPEPCPKCEGETRKLVTGCGVIFKGDDWSTKNGRVARQMAKKNSRLNQKQDEKVRDGGIPGGRLAPNVGGERVDSWSEAAKLAKSKGKDTTGYEKLARKEKA